MFDRKQPFSSPSEVDGLTARDASIVPSSADYYAPMNVRHST